MIDIHCHLLYGVDDGPSGLKESVMMLKEAKRQGVNSIILTPHYRHGMFPFNGERVQRHFEKLCEYAERIGVQIYLGTEYHVNSLCIQYLDSGRCLTLAGSEYVLTEYSYETEYSYIRNMTQELLFHGYTPVVAHVERYECMLENPNYAEELQGLGAWIQINADAVLGLEGRRVKHCCRYLLKNNIADVVASDSHGIEKRTCHLEKCWNYISRKYGESAALRVLEQKPGKIIRSIQKK